MALFTVQQKIYKNMRLLGLSCFDEDRFRSALTIHLTNTVAMIINQFRVFTFSLHALMVNASMGVLLKKTTIDYQLGFQTFHVAVRNSFLES